MNSTDDNCLLNCFICFQKVRRAKMCPYCSKIGCYQCLKLWFDNSRNECPYCRQQATLASFADCGRFVDELKEKLSSHEEKNKSKDVCPEHQIQMRYFCQTCKIPFCPDCSTFEDGHKGHKIVLLGKILQSQKDKIHKELNKFDVKSKEYRKNGLIIKTKYQQLNQQKKSKKIFLQSYLKDRLQQLDKQFRQKQSQILLKLENNQQDKQLLVSLKQTLISDINQFSQIDTIVKADQMIQLINTLCNRNVDNADLDCSLISTHDIFPQFHQFIYKLNDFSTLTDYSVVYSESYMLNGIEWRLKVYPKGNGQAKDKCLSVFLQMTSAFENKKEYQYKIELVNQYSQSESLVRQYISLFQIGECWGYNQFIELTSLGGGFLDENRLIFKFSVRPKGYKNQVIDQGYYIRRLEAQIKELEKGIVPKSNVSGNKLQRGQKEKEKGGSGSIKRTELSRSELLPVSQGEKQERVIKEDRNVQSDN